MHERQGTFAWPPHERLTFLNMTQYSLLTQVPSGKMSRGLESDAATCSLSLSQEHRGRTGTGEGVLRFMHHFNNTVTVNTRKSCQPKAFTITGLGT